MPLPPLSRPMPGLPAIRSRYELDGAHLIFLQPIHPPRTSRSDVSHEPGVEERSDDTPGYRGPAPRPRQGSQIRQPVRGLAPFAGCLSFRLSPGVSLALNPRLMAGKPPACKIDATSLQETGLRPHAPEWRRSPIPGVAEVRSARQRQARRARRLGAPEDRRSAIQSAPLRHDRSTRALLRPHL